MTVDYKKMKAAQLREEIIDTGALPEDAVNDVKGKAALVALHQSLVNNLVETEDTINEEDEEDLEALRQSLLEAQADQTEPPTEEIEVPETMPSKLSPEWNDYVMSLFSESELEKGNPKVAGLRRVAQNLVGKIVSSGPTEVIASTANQLGRATVRYAITFIDIEDQNVTYGGVGSAFPGNLDPDFEVYAETVAETRAEARALRKALGIQGISADEVTSKDVQAEAAEYKERHIANYDDPNELISAPQVKAISVMCERLDIDVEKFINSGEGRYVSVDTIPKVKATKMLQRLTEFQSKIDTEVPEEIKK